MLRFSRYRYVFGYGPPKCVCVIYRYFVVAEVGSEVGGGGVRLPGLLPRHCVIAHTEGVVTGQYSTNFPPRRADLVFLCFAFRFY